MHSCGNQAANPQLCCADKSERLKQAKKEAEKEVATYKQQREDAYQKRIKDVRCIGYSQFCSPYEYCTVSNVNSDVYRIAIILEPMCND